MTQLKNYIKLTFVMSILFFGRECLIGQSASWGNTFIHENGESVVFGQHDFINGGQGVLPGVIGTERQNNKGYFAFSNVSLGWTGANDRRYVDGYVKYYGSGPFTFPVGDDGYYRPIAITGAAETKVAYYRVNPDDARTTSVFGGTLPALPAGAPFNREQKENAVNKVSPVEYWDIDGVEPTKITLTWDVDSDITALTNNDLQKLSIVGWNGTEWKKIPSKTDLVYLDADRSSPRYNAGLSTLIQGSITSEVDIMPDEYDAYTFASVGLAFIGDLVWEDMNRNGIQEDGEPPLPNVLVELYDADKVYISSTTSDNFGRYFFEGVEPGRYYVKFNSPTSFSPTLAGQGSSIGLNSDVTFNGFTPSINIAANQVEFSIDGGFYTNGSIGNSVWLDDGDGVREDGEEGLKDVVVELLDLDYNIQASTVSGDNGEYSFTNLPPGEYIIRFVPPAGHEFSPLNSITDRTLDSDADPSTGMTEIISLLSGQDIMDYDAGFSSPCLYTAEIEVIQPLCGLDNGEITVVVEGDTGPYTYEWNISTTSNTVSDLPPGEYEVVISDSEECNRTFLITLEYEEGCDPVCGEVRTSVFLEGTFNFDAGEMNAQLNSLGYLPGQKPVTFFGKYTDAGQPYNREPWFYGGSEGLSFGVKNKTENNKDYPIDAVDWVLVSLREVKDVEYATCTRAGILLQDGNIIFPDDDCCVINPTKEYYVVIEHRNHLIVMSKDPIPVVDGVIEYDFRDKQSFRSLFGYGQKEVIPGVFAMYAANGDQYLDGESPVDINVSDLAEWLKENGYHSSYYFMDFDLNGDANVQDKGLYLQNIGIFTDVPKQ